ncbi:16S rRNA (guanine(527)-N(7))-methyltransferase RsmG [Nostocoides sp. F2B08]|uniref:16S rRNA (guanine(527)-N(7))-methyltransferase RsmG n=1 Tax=Nostocoides sp. F2B08 TaxID=2653936 RepID=UPI00351AADF5
MSPTPVVPDPPPAARVVFGERVELAVRFARYLADTGITHGLIGPREVPRLWDRHILNCAVVADEIESGASVIDVGSGAGLPGLALAIARPDLMMTLIEPMERRTAWLDMVTADIGLDVTVVRARAEEMHSRMTADVVTARAVAPLDRLARWCLPLLPVGGRLVAMKGSSAEREISEATATLQRLGGGKARIRLCGSLVLDDPTTVVVVDKVREGLPQGRGKTGTSSPSRANGSGHRNKRRSRTSPQERTAPD